LEGRKEVCVLIVVGKGEALLATKRIEECGDAQLEARLSAQHEQAERNWLWLQDHWDDLLPQAAGKFVAVAGEEAFLADDASMARSQAVEAHPADKGVIVQFVRAEKGPQIDANPWDVGPVR
jgi:hypothetical protein